MTVPAILLKALCNTYLCSCDAPGPKKITNHEGVGNNRDQCSCTRGQDEGCWKDLSSAWEEDEVSQESQMAMCEVWR